MSDAIHSFGTRIYYGDFEALGQDNALAEVVDVAGPNISVSSPEVTHLTSGLDGIDEGFREFLAGLGDGGEVTLTLNYLATQTVTLMGLLRQRRSWRITFPNRVDYFRMNGHITNLGTSFQEDTEITQDVTFKITGKPSFQKNS